MPGLYRSLCNRARLAVSLLYESTFNSWDGNIDGFDGYYCVGRFGLFRRKEANKISTI